MNQRYRGMFLLDALLGTMIAATVVTAVVVVAATQQRGANKLAESRSHIRALESALTQLQTGGAAPRGVSIHPVAAAAAPTGWVWVEATSDSGAMVLRGLIPASGANRGSK